jgi:hypothetical protein
MSQSLDRLYNLLPTVYRQRDADQGYVLQALLQIIAEQMNLVEDDIAQLYDNWFVETCQDWVVPYIGELIGYKPAYSAGEPGDAATEAGQQRNKILFPRGDVANTIGNRRRRGTLSLLARQALDVAGWPARAVEFHTLLGLAQSVIHLNPQRGRLVDLRNGDALDRLGGAFEDIAHTVDTRRLSARSSAGRYNIPSVGLFVWRLKSYTVTMRQPYCQESVGPHCYNFSALGNDTSLFARAEPPAPGMPIAGEIQVPAPIRRRSFERRLRDFYGENKSLQIFWIPPTAPQTRGSAADMSARVMIPPENIIAADLSDWQYRTPRGKVAVDPVLGRISFPPSTNELPRRGIWVTYNYGFSADIGGGEYPRALTPATSETKIYQVGERAPFRRIAQALEQWRQDRPRRAFIEISDSGVYVEQVAVDLDEGQTLELRASSGSAPVIRLLDWQTEQPDSLTVAGKTGSCFVLDGILVAGRGMQVSGELGRLSIRHSTLVPGWSLMPNCEPRRPAEPSLELNNVDAHITIDHSIVGSIQVLHDEVLRDPIRIDIADSILDATSQEREALGAPGWPFAHAVLTVRRSTVFGQIQTHAIELGENSIFDGQVRVARRQLGCVRFCYVAPGSRTPRRYSCQPDLAVQPIDDQLARGEITQAEHDQAREREELRVQPEYNSVRYGAPTYCQLAPTCADEIRRGADDESEMGVFHDLFQPQREANLRGRLRDFTPAGVDGAIVFVS